ncbi:MAG: thioredoxin fold domain-containing protein [bacterium]|nr:thioredoxin fold domain-containing protein [bacterium]
MKFSVLLIIVLLSIIGLSSYGYGQFFEKNFSAEPDLDALVKYDEGIVLFKISVDDAYHITDLKNGFFKIELNKNDYLEIIKVDFPKGIAYADETVYKGNLEIPVIVKPLKEITGPVTLTFKVSYQICQEKPEELCYPPDDKDVDVKVDKAFKVAAAKELKEKEDTVKTRSKKEDEAYLDWFERIIKQELENPSFFLFMIVFIAGFLTSLTPCVFPIIPIVMGYIGTRKGNNKFKGLYLSLFFVLGLAIVYSTFGTIAMATSSMMGGTFQNPIVVIVIASIFVLMGLSLAGFFEIPVPTSISSKVGKGHKSEIFGSILIGGIAGVIAVPCVGPILIGLITAISVSGDIVLGFWLTFTFSMGMGVLFLIVGTFSGALAAMPKGSKWMSYVKYFFALILLSGGVYFITTITHEWFGFFIWGVLLVAAAIFMGLFKSLEEDAEYGSKVFKVVLVLLFLTGAFLFVKALDMNFSPAKHSYAKDAEVNVSEVKDSKPIVLRKANLTWIPDLEEGKKIAKAENKIMMIDTYADWCIACKELEHKTFPVPEVEERLKKLVLVKMDFTKKDKVNETKRKALRVFGMPTIIFFKPDGTEITRFSGFKDKDDFLKVLDSLK